MKSDDQFGALESHGMDVVCLVKRNAADDVLAQDPRNQRQNSQTIIQSVGLLIALFALLCYHLGHQIMTPGYLPHVLGSPAGNAL